MLSDIIDAVRLEIERLEDKRRKSKIKRMRTRVGSADD